MLKELFYLHTLCFLIIYYLFISSLSVVVNLGSESNFSTTLYDLATEISPLQKMNKCPKDFKRTSVERYFRANGFNLDWCSFKLVSKI